VSRSLLALLYYRNAVYHILLARAPAIVIEFAHHRRARVSRRNILRASVPVLVKVLDAERPGVRVLPRSGVILYKHGHADGSRIRGQQMAKGSETRA
jgi:hypothetical protein